MSTKKKATKKTEKQASATTEERDYDIDDNEDYVVILKPTGETKAFYPMDLVKSEPSEQKQVDIRFIAVTHMLQDQESFDFAVERFKQASGFTGEEESVTEGSDKE